MNKFVFGALAVTTASTLGFANGEDWMTLDREIESLAASGMAQGGSGFTLDGWVKTSYASSSDVTVGGNDLGGFSLDSIRANLDGAIGDFNVHVALEGSDDVGMGYFGVVGNAVDAGVIDAYVTFSITEQVAVQAGLFRTPFLNDSLRDENEFLFIDRTASGDSWAFRDQGVLFSFMMDQFSAWLGAQNGVDAQGDDLVLTGRVEFNAMGQGASSTEGAYGATDENSLNLGAGYWDDDFITDGTAISFDADFNRGPLYAAASLVDYDDGLTGAFGGETPWDATFSYMFAPDEWEAAIRWEDFDDTNDTSMLAAGVNYYVEGHDVKWQLNYSTIDSDVSTNEVDVLALAMLVSV